MKKRRVPFRLQVIPRVSKRVFLGWLNTCRNLKRNMGMNGVPFGPIGMKPGPGCRKFGGASFWRKHMCFMSNNGHKYKKKTVVQG